MSSFFLYLLYEITFHTNDKFLTEISVLLLLLNFVSEKTKTNGIQMCMQTKIAEWKPKIYEKQIFFFPTFGIKQMIFSSNILLLKKISFTGGM